MHAAPAFELTVALSAAERLALALLGCVVAGALATWVWTHAQAAAGPTGGGWWPGVVAVAGVCALGAWAGWRAAPDVRGTIGWRQGQWTWVETGGGDVHDGALEPVLDLGSWLLLVFKSRSGASWWLTAGRGRAGVAWHPLRCALFAPGGIAVENPGESAAA